MPPPSHIVPPVVYVPCERPDPDGAGVGVDLRQTRDGRTALLVYTALDRLVTCCGHRQPWVVMPTAKLDVIGGPTPVDLVLFDVDIPTGMRRGAVPAGAGPA